MVFGWWKSKRRRRRREAPFPAEWERAIDRWFYPDHWLSNAERQRLRDWIKVFLPEKNWEGCGGLRMTDEIRVAISAHVGWLVLGLDDEYFDQVPSILVYPDAYRAPGEQRENWIVSERGTPRLGEAWWRGPVILSWKQVRRDGGRPGADENLVLHEFSHQLDLQNGQIIDGTPPLDSREQVLRWVAAMTPAYEELTRLCRERRRHPVLSCYGTTHVGEFFAVSTESFFTQPVEFEESLPDVYAVMRDYYRQDPARQDRRRAIEVG